MAATRRAPLRVCCCLQAKGFNVRATVRSKADAAKVAHLTCLATALPGVQTAAACTVTLQPTSLACSTRCAALCCMPAGSVELVEADLLVEGAFDAAFAGCRYVFHTASPFFIEAGDPQAQLVDPAVKGTRNVMQAVARNKADVRRIVLTSSCAGGWVREEASGPTWLPCVACCRLNACESHPTA